MSDLMAIRVVDIEPNPNNPRKYFNPESLQELAQSIKEVGILQPLVVVSITHLDKYRLVCGERRWRAAQLGGLEYVPAIIRVLTPKQEAELMLIENLQRKDLDPIEEARAYQALLAGHDYTQEALGEKLGVSQGHIANRMRLLELPESVKQNISRGIISASAAKELLASKRVDRAIIERVAERAAKEGMTVKQVSEAVSKEVWDSSKPLTADGWPEPKFDVEPCDKCKRKSMLSGPYQSGEKLRCLDANCWAEKQKEAEQKAVEDREQEYLAKFPDALIIDDLGTPIVSLYGNTEEYCRAKGCENLKTGRYRGAGFTRIICLDPEKSSSCHEEFSKKQGQEQEDQTAKVQEEISRAVGIAMDENSKAESGIFFSRKTLLYLAGVVLSTMEEYNAPDIYDYLGFLTNLEKDNIPEFEGMMHDVEGWPQLLEILDRLPDHQLHRIIIEWPAFTLYEKEGGLVDWFLKPGEEAEPDQDPVRALIGYSIMTHYNTGGIVTNVIGPKDDGFYTINYKGPNDRGKHFRIINSITVSEGVVLCEGIPLTILDKAPGETSIEPDPVPEEPAEEIQSTEPAQDTSESEFSVISVVTGRVKRCMDCKEINEDRICAAFGFERISLTSPQHCQHYKLREDVDIESILESIEQADQKESESKILEQAYSDTQSTFEVEPKRYLDENGRELFVEGLSDEFGTFWRPHPGGLHRVKSPAMPMVATGEEAQRNLDAYAEKKCFKLVTEEPNENVLAVLEIDDADPDWKEALEGLTGDELQQAIERETRPSARSKLRAELRRRKGDADVQDQAAS